MRHRRRNSSILPAFATALLLTIPALAGDGPTEIAGPQPVQPIEARVRAAALVTYVHGMNAEIAVGRVGTTGIPVLRALLAEDEFERRDNVVAFLAYLGGDAEVEPLLDLLRFPPAGGESPADDRAMLLVPEALGRLASRGATTALDALLQITDPAKKSGPLDAAVAQGRLSAAMRDDLIEESLRGLALSGLPEAGQRLRQLEAAHSVPSLATKRADRSLRTALGLMDGGNTGPSTVDGAGSGGAGDSAPADAIEEQPAVPDTTRGGVDDPSAVSHLHGLSYANHVDTPSPIGDTTLDNVLLGASRKAGYPDFAEDVACCAATERSASGAVFGTSGDGLDRIDSSDELDEVLGNNVARVKVVRAINYCGSPGTNIVGCAYTPGRSMVVVRISSNEDALWLHEYGHNLGLPHNADSRYVMHGLLTSQARGLSLGECGTFHDPPGQAQALLSEIGVCHDNDLDDYVSSVDNCPDVFNPDQSDGDGDGLGDVCDVCVDADLDGYSADGDPACAPGGVDCDDSRAEVHPGAVDLCDGLDNDCNGVADDAVCDEFEATGDGRVSGYELAWIGRAFGECDADPAGRWWFGTDYTHDGCIDGDDLAVLGAVWGCEGSAPVCE